jgi:histidinol-phosphate aminotransferase
MDYRKLARENILSLEPYIPGKSIDEIKELYNVTEIIKMASNENPIGPSPKACEAIVNNLSKIHLYPLSGSPYLRNILSEKLGINTDEIIFGNGSDDLIEILLLTFLKQGEHALTVSPTFSEYFLMTKAVGGECRFVPLERDFTFNFDRLNELINKYTKVIFLANPNNPTGTYFNSSYFIRFMENVSSAKIVVLDEAYAEYVEAEDFPKSFHLREKFKNLVIMRTFSKAYGLAGLRVGYAVANKNIIALMDKVRQPFNVNSLAQVAACAAICDENHLKKIFKMNLEGKYYLYSSFDRMGLDYIKSQANFILVAVGDGLKVSEGLLKEGIIVRYMGQQLHEYIRVTVGTMEENEIFIKKLMKVMGETI